MKKMKSVIIFLMLITGCAAAGRDNMLLKTEEKHIEYINAYKDIKVEELMSLSSQADWAINLEDASLIYELSDYLAIIRIDSIEGAMNINEFDGSIMYPSTIGQFTILQNIKGEFEFDQSYNYVRMGGILPYEQYLEGLHEKQREKIEANMDGIQPPKYVQRKFEGDIDIELGRVYLAYFNKSEHRQNAYSIIFIHAGLREILVNDTYEKNTNSNVDDKSIYVLNNTTGEWQLLESLIPDDNIQ